MNLELFAFFTDFARSDTNGTGGTRLAFDSPCVAPIVISLSGHEGFLFFSGSQNHPNTTKRAGTHLFSWTRQGDRAEESYQSDLSRSARGSFLLDARPKPPPDKL